MDERNVGTREACQKLVENGIVLETDFYYVKEKTNEADHYELMLKIEGRFIPTQKSYYTSYSINECDCTPAVQFAEVWRELPNGTRIIHRGDKVQVYGEYDWETMFYSTNPTDALIELLIFVTEQKKDSYKDFKQQSKIVAQGKGKDY
jgi:hypothetical protein